MTWLYAVTTEALGHHTRL